MTRLWNSIPMPVRSGLTLIFLGSGVIGVLVYEHAWVLAAIGLLLAVTDLILGRHDNSHDRHRQN